MSTEQLVSSPMGDAPVQDEEVQQEEFLEIDVVDDVPESDRGRRPPEGFNKSEHEEEIKSVGQSVQKRIKKLKYDYHEERRGKESQVPKSETSLPKALKRMKFGFFTHSPSRFMTGRKSVSRPCISLIPTVIIVPIVSIRYIERVAAR